MDNDNSAQSTCDHEEPHCDHKWDGLIIEFDTLSGDIIALSSPMTCSIYGCRQLIKMSGYSLIQE